MARSYSIAISGLLSLLLAVPAFATTATLLSDTQQAQQNEAQHNHQREAKFKQTEQQLQKQYKSLQKQQRQLQASIAMMSQRFKSNEALLSKKEQQLTLATGSLGELFGVVRQASKNIQNQQSPLATLVNKADEPILERILAAKSIPSKTDLYGLWHLYQHQIDASSTIQTMTVPFVHHDGVVKGKSVVRFGLFNLLGDDGYLKWDAQQKVASPVLVQPSSAPTALMVNKITEDLPVVTLDVTGGELLQQLANEPTLMQRVQQGGVVGKIILALLAFGLAIALYRLSVLLMIKSKIQKQLKNLDQPSSNNPLGRVMLVHKKEKNPNIEALELRLLEVIMDEQQQLEMGISTIKLLAALAPMLGLLGTVTGMIDTFQTITQFGNADPRIMAGGISMALITTVLGLIAAMPLLLVHNGLSSLAETIRTIIEKQGIGLVAQNAEQQQRNM